MTGESSKITTYRAAILVKLQARVILQACVISASRCYPEGWVGYRASLLWGVRANYLLRAACCAYARLFLNARFVSLTLGAHHNVVAAAAA